MELIVVMAIMGIMASVGIVSLQSSKSDSRLKATQREVAASIKQAQSYALQGRMQEGETPCEYGFEFTSVTDYQIFYRLPVSGSCASMGSETTVESFSISNGVVLYYPTTMDKSKIRFSIPFANMTGPNAWGFGFRYSDGSFNTMVISRNGSIVEQ